MQTLDPSRGTLNVIYEDVDMAVLDKPAGVAVHPAAPEGQTSPHKVGRAPREKTLVDEIIARWPEAKNVGEDPVRPGIVHRLDKETSGVMLVAKTQAGFLWLKQQFQERKVIKKYFALVAGKMPQASGVIAKPIGRSRKFGKFTTKLHKNLSRERINKAREATTKWRVLKEFESCALLELEPETGRTHQLRVHLAAIGHPVIGDALYGGKASQKYRELLGNRHFLHASSLELTLPSGARFNVESELPQELQNFLKGLPGSENLGVLR